MYTNRSRGFTLIELLVVIAIIGILSAVVLASLNTARSKGNDAAVKSNLDTIRTQSAIFYDSQTPNGYGPSATTASLTPTAGNCSAVSSSILTDPNVTAAIAGANKAVSTGTVVCAYSAGMVDWVVYGQTANNPTGMTGWCVDSTGISKASTVPTAAGGAKCP